MAKFHEKINPTDPAFILMAEAIREMNARTEVWASTGLSRGMSEIEIRQAIGSAYIGLAANFYRNTCGVSMEDFLQVAEEEYEMRRPDAKETPTQ